MDNLLFVDSHERERLQREVGRSFKLARLRAGLTQGEVASLMGVTQPWVSKVEKSARQLGIVEAWKLAEILDVDLEKIKAACFEREL